MTPTRSPGRPITGQTIGDFTIRSIPTILMITLLYSSAHAAEPVVEPQAGGSRFGMQSLITAVEGKGDELAGILLQASQAVAALDGCQLYIVQRSVSDESQLLITEVWRDQASHQASLNDQSVRDLIDRARPIIAGMEGRPALFLGGHGLGEDGVEAR